jgi:hypothetical protein
MATVQAARPARRRRMVMQTDGMATQQRS